MIRDEGVFRMLGISTCWWHGKSATPEQIISDIKDFGLSGIELEYRLSEDFYDHLRNIIPREIKVLSIHNFFPRPRGFDKGSGDLFLLSSTDNEERQKAIKYTIKSIQIAEETGAEVVVVHLGHVDMPHQKEFLSSKELNGHNLKVTEEMIKLREERWRFNLEAVFKSLERINREADKRGILVGIENRYYFHEIPDKRELAIIFQEFKGSNLRYWHDVGHAHAHKEMGILKDDTELMDEFEEYLIGVHLHDAVGFQDHRSPGEGEIDFLKLKRYLNRRIIKILELNPWVKRKKVLKGIRLIESIIYMNG